MSVTVILGHASDGYLESSSTNYASALSGTNLLVPGSGSPLMYWGQSLGAGVRYVWQGFVRFGWTADTDSTPVAAMLFLQPGSTAGTGTSRDLEVRAYNWGTSVTTGNWRTPAQLNAAALRGRIVDAHRAGTSQMRIGLDPDTFPGSSGQLHYVLVSSRNRLQQAPSGLEWQTLRQAEAANTVAQRPTLYVGSSTKHLLDLSLGAQMQLSDGTHVYVTQTDTAPGPLTFQVWHHDGNTATALGELASVAARRGSQTMAVCVDDHDTVYVANDSSSDALLIRAWERTPSGWSGPTQDRTLRLPMYGQRVNNLALAWHPQGGNRGTIMAVVCREAGTNTGAQAAYALVNVDHVLTGAGSALRGSGNATGTVIATQPVPGFNNPSNETGTLLDVTAVRDANGQVADRGYVLSTGQHQVLGARSAQSTARYQLNTNGTAITTARTIQTVSGFSRKDPDTKSRVLPISRTQFCTVNASDSVGFGIVVKHHQQSAGSSFDVLADVRLGAQPIASMPAPGVVAYSAAWDAMYDPATHLVWVYYLDAGNPRRLMKTHIDLATGLAAADEIEVAADIGPAGSTNLAIRVHRGETTGQGVLISVANRTTAGTHSMVLVTELVNLPPEAPARSPRANFDAVEPATFVWQFRDPNPTDTQGAYQLQIWDDTTDTLVYDTDHTTSTEEFHQVAGATLNNDEAFRWRVRTWDSFAEQGPWSTFGFFATSASGNVTITYPDQDNPEGLETADLLIGWQVIGATQDHYRVRVYTTANGVLHSDTGWVESTSTTHLVQGLASEVEHRIEVTARAAMVESSTGTRLVTPDYSQPVDPVITVVPAPDRAHLRIEVDNPEPGTDLSQLDGSFETGIEGWSTGLPLVVGSHSDLLFGTTATVNLPTGVQDGDLMLLWVGGNFGTGHTPGPAWGTPEVDLVIPDTTHHGTLYVRRADNEPNSYTVTWVDSQWHSAALVVLRGAHGLGAWHANTTTAATTLEHPAVEVVVGGLTLLLAFTVSAGASTLPPDVLVLEDNGRGVIAACTRATQPGTVGPWEHTHTGTGLGMIAASQEVEAAVQIFHDDARAHGGTYSARLQVNSPVPVAQMRPDVDYRVEVQPYSRYTINLWVYTTVSHEVSAALDFYDEDGVLLSTLTGPTTTPQVGEWELVSFSASAPQDAAWAGYGLDLHTPTSGDTVWVDNLELRTATDIPTPTANQIWRSTPADPPVLVATVDPGLPYSDHLVGSGRNYTYFARAVTPDGAHADSGPVTEQVYFLGVWIHDPGDAEETLDQYLYGKAQRSHAVDVTRGLHQFVGRTRPVATWGEDQVDTWQITVDIPDGPDRIMVIDRLQGWAESRRAVVVRDNRGRVWVSALDGFSVTDQEWGDQITFVATRVSSDLPGSVR